MAEIRRNTAALATLPVLRPGQQSGVPDFRAIFDASPTAQLLLSNALTMVGANPAYLRLAGLSEADILGRNVFEVFPARVLDAAQRLRISYQRALDGIGDTVHLLHYPIREFTDGAWVDRFWSVSNQPWFGPDGAVRGIVSCVQDVTDLSSRLAFHGESGLSDLFSGTPSVAARALDGTRIRRLMQQAPGFLAIARGPRHVIEFANDAYYRLVGHRDLLEKPVREALPELHGQGFFELLDGVYASGKPFTGRAVPIEVHTGDGGSDLRYIDFIYQPVFDAEGCVSGIFVQGHDVTETHTLAQQVGYQATHDPLTGLANRRAFEERLRELVSQAVEDGRAAGALVYFDLDQFKIVNDTCGHPAGDELLRILSSRVQRELREEDLLARLGGDEFGLLLPGCAVQDALECAERLRRAIHAFEFVRDQRVFGCSASFGVVALLPGAESADRLVSSADAACYLAKEKGRDRVQLHEEGDEDLARQRRDMDSVSRLRAALKEQRFELWAQPIEPATRAQDGAGECHREILVRLRDTDGSLVPPMAFIPAAERYGIMPAIDRYVIEASFRYLGGLRPDRAGRVSINVSGHTLSDEGLPEFLDALRKRLDVDPQRICFEVTETAAVRDLSRTVESMHRLKQLGFSFALDDFGSGMSSLGYLRTLPVDYLKIDGIFIRNVHTDEVDAAMVRSIAEVARVMGIRTVAEYVDSEASRARLAALGVDLVQGFGVGMPAPLA